MSKLVPVFYAMMVGWGALTLDYPNHTLPNPSDPGADSVTSVSSRKAVLPGVVGGHVDLAQLLPSAPQGWTRRPYDRADGQRITGVFYDPKTPVHDTTAAILRDYNASTASDQKIAVTYESGNQLVVLRLAYDRDQTVSHIEHTASTGGAVPGLPPGAHAYGKIKGIAYDQAAISGRNLETGPDLDADFRLLMATMGRQASLTVLSNADDTSLQRVLGSVDTQAVGQFLQDPAATAAALAKSNRQPRSAVADGP